jgi:outer membrane murein-binding lipoprotein Lpp
VLAGSVTLTGTNLAHPDGVDSTVVCFILLDGSTRLVHQKVIETTTGGVVTPTSIVIPAAIVPVGVVAGCRVKVLYTSLASGLRTLCGSVSGLVGKTSSPNTQIKT